MADLDISSIIEAVSTGKINLTEDQTNQVKLSKEKKLSDHKADCKRHLAALEEAADKEEDEDKKKKLSKKAKKLKAKMSESEEDGEEIDLSMYPIDEASLSSLSDEISELKSVVKNLTNLMAETQSGMAKLSAAPKQTKDETIAKLKSALADAIQLAEGDK